MNWVHGIDISHHQQDIDWASVAASGRAQFAYLKATERHEFVDKRLTQNIQGCDANGIPWAGYHFARPQGDPVADALRQARHFLATCPAGPLPDMLDLEATELSPPDTATWALTWLDEVQRERGRAPVLYTGAFFEVESRTDLAAFPLWMARYTAGNVPDPDPTQIDEAPTRAPWNAWSIWQYTSKGQVAGIHGSVDRNVADPEWFARAHGQQEEDDMFQDDDRALLNAVKDAVLDGPIEQPTQRVVHTVIARTGDLNNTLLRESQLTRAEFRRQAGDPITDAQLDALAEAIAAGVADRTITLTRLSDDDIDRIAKAAADEQARRLNP